jgi:hypothetical protein
MILLADKTGSGSDGVGILFAPLTVVLFGHPPLLLQDGLVA